MINSFSKILFLMMMFNGTIISISASSWMGMWMGLELNLLSFIPLMIDNKNIFSNEASIKYFLVQVFASLIFLFSSIFYMLKINFSFNLFYNIINYENFIINLTMMLKLGAAPFHFWFPNILEGLSWNNSLLMLTWQKLAPLMILSYSKISNLIMIFIISSSIIGAMAGLNQTSIRKLLAYSSINHMSWLFMSLLLNNILWNFYFFFYSMMNFSVIIYLKLTHNFNINQLFLFNNNNSLMKFCFFMNFLSLGGLPPFLGFFPKWIIIENYIMNKNLFIIFLAIMMALITLFFYIRISFAAFLFYYPSYSWNQLFFFKNYFLQINLFLNFLMISCLWILLYYFYLT